MIRTREGRRARAALVGLFLLAAAGCGRQAAPGGGPGPEAGWGGGEAGPKLLFITNGNSNWWNAVERGMLDGGKAFGARVQLRRNDGQTQGQVDKLKEALSLPGVQGVAVSVIEADAPGVIDAMRELRRAGKFVVAIDSDVSAENADARDAYIGTDNVKAGEFAGKAAALLRPDGGKVAIFVGTAAAANARGRRDGFFAGAGKTFSAERARTWEDGNDQNKARTNVQTALTKDPDVALLLGLWSYNGPAIGEEVGGSAAVRKRTTVVTFDLEEAAVGQLERGNIDATVCQNPYEMGYQAVRLLKALVDKDDKTIKDVLPDGKVRDTGVRVVVPKADSPVKALGGDVITIDEMKTWMGSKGIKSS